ncbi:chromate transporter [Dethiobacter alkaliphilus]|uniref:Chromate transporter n=1 Tax=Dethiobacter alkaliphilus AHT 1 TaxID=555088 RepID=C0GCL7_DETAL|nr:chromate transporter [Dethiobacter alkaliphilus]EEG78952.1 Chromate transporter [Dethiobacter alkaliphilus AHT 1]
MKQNPYFQLFSTFFKIGATTFGGGYAMLPIIKREVVETHGWLHEDEFVDVLAVAQSSPGAVAINSAIFIGCKLHGYPGAVASMLGAVLPSFIVILTIAIFFARYTEIPVVAAAFAGIRPAVAALIAAAVLKIGKPVLKSRTQIIFALAFLILSSAFNVHPVAVIVLGAGSGLLLSYLSTEQDGEDNES